MAPRTVRPSDAGPGQTEIQIDFVHKIAFIQALMHRGHMTESSAKDLLKRIGGLATGGDFELMGLGKLSESSSLIAQMQSTMQC